MKINNILFPVSVSALVLCIFDKGIEIFSGPASSVGIATDYGLDSPGSSPGGDEIFRHSRPVLGPTKPL